MKNRYKSFIVYTDDEVALLQDHISGLQHWDETTWSQNSDSINNRGYNNHLIPFYPIRERDSTLFSKLQQDPQVEIYSIYSFFPKTYKLVYSSEPPSINFKGRSRGQVAILHHKSGSLVIKPYQSKQEPYITDTAGNLGLGPQQSKSIGGFLTESFLSDPFLTDLPKSLITPDLASNIGANLGRLLLDLHREKIVYNDTTVSDPTGRSHLLISKDASCQLIDFGVSVWLDSIESLSLEEVYNLARTTPMFRLFSGFGHGAAEVVRFLYAYKKELSRTTAESIMERDVKFVEQGIKVLGGRIGDWIVEPFLSGFFESYR